MEKYIHGAKDKERDLICESGVDALKAVFTRGSIRKFEKREIEKKVLDTVLYAGMCAPSAMNKRPYEIVVLTGEMKDKIAEFSRQPEMLKSAAACICVCGDKAKQDYIKFIIEDCSAVIENMLLVAHALGLGAVWCGIRENTEWNNALVRELKLPENVLPMSVITVGYPSETKGHDDRFEKCKLHYNKW